MELLRKLLVVEAAAVVMAAAVCSSARAATPSVNGPKSLSFGFVGIHGGVAEALASAGSNAAIRVVHLPSDQLSRLSDPFKGLDVVFLAGFPSEGRERLLVALKKARTDRPGFVVLSCSSDLARPLPVARRDGVVIDDRMVWDYCTANRHNFRRLLDYVAIKYCGRRGTPEPPDDTPPPAIFHPDGPEAGFTNVTDFLVWETDRLGPLRGRRRVVVLAYDFQALFQQKAVVEALIRSFEKRGYVAIGLSDKSPGWENRELEFAPDVVVHTCHGSETPATMEKLDVPHLISLYTKRCPMDRYLQDPGVGLATSELQHQLASQELRGEIEPLFVGCSLKGDGEDAVLPVAERVEHLVDRADAWATLRRKTNADKKVAIIYYDHAMGKGELMVGTATGMFMNAPRSVLNVLRRLEKEGYRINNAPTNETALLDQMRDHGRLVGAWMPEVLKRKAESGLAVLVPETEYVKWFEEKVPAEMRAAVVHQWGPPPGKFMVYTNPAGSRFLVVPRLDYGNVILLPQPLRGEAQTIDDINALVHDKLTPPPHNYLATYFWLQEGFKADAMIHFGTHGSEFYLPGKPNALTDRDWSDRVVGRIPNLTVWIVNNVGESTPARRRASATLIDHLTPPFESAGLDDEMKNLQADIQKWTVVEDGALKESFRRSIDRQVAALDLSGRLGLKPPLAAADIEKVARHLERLADETAPMRLHVFGERPSEAVLRPYLVRCAGRSFLEALVPYVSTNIAARRAVAQTALAHVLDQDCDPGSALRAAGAAVPEPLPKALRRGFDVMVKLDHDYTHTDDEINNLVRALSGRFIAPGPANSPDRNPGSVPTGRDMFVINPEEIPTPESWELGKKLANDLLADWKARKGRYPNKVAFCLSATGSCRDYGIIESQIFWLLGVRPVWDERRLVRDVELVPAARLGRPRVDVFLSAHGFYRDQLPTRMKLIDRAIRMIEALDETNNFVRANTLRVERELTSRGIAPDKARILSQARMFGSPPGQYGNSWYLSYIPRTGSWNSREDLIKVYLEQNQYVYTQGAWGENSPVTYERTIQGAEEVVRSWADSVSSPLSKRYMWAIDGNLALVIRCLTGKEPEYHLADVRDPTNARMIRAEDALADDFHVSLFNPKWIKGMMKEGYAGTDLVAVHVSNMLGWEIMREGSVSASNWMEVVNVYVCDSKNLKVREWFDRENPHAFQEIVQKVMEASRKGYWTPPPGVLQELAQAFDASVVKYGASESLGNYNAAFNFYLAKSLGHAPSTGPIVVPQASFSPAVAPAASAVFGKAPPVRTATVAAVRPVQRQVAGVHLVERPAWPHILRGIVPVATALLLLLIGFFRRQGGI